MIYEAMQIITDDINNFLGDFSETKVVMENIAMIDDVDTTGIILTLLNLQEEFTLKNRQNHYVNSTNISYKNPKVNLNLYLLFSVNLVGYKESLKSISKVIQFFQGKRIFTQSNTNFDRDGAEMTEIKNFRFLVDLYAPSFEELNYIWGTLGGKQHPSVLYKVSFIEIERDVLLSKGTVITEINNILIDN